MKHVKSFENFKINEEVLGFSAAEKSAKRKEKLKADLDKYVPVYVRKGAIEQPTPADLDKFMADAEKDDFQGVVAVDNRKYDEKGELVMKDGKPEFLPKGTPGKIGYRREKDVNWGSASGHTFGAGR